MQYLIELNKIIDADVYLTLEKKGRAVQEDETISHILRYVKPENGVIKLYLYEGIVEDNTLEKF